MNALRTRLFAAFLAVILLAVFVISLVLVVLLRNNPLVERQTYARLHTIATVIVREATVGGDAPASGLRAAIEQAATDFDARVLLTDTSGQVLLDSAPALEGNLLLRGFRNASTQAAYPQALLGRVRDTRLRVWLYVARPIAGDRMLVIASRPPGFSALVFFSENLLGPLLQAAALTALVAGVLAVLFARSIAQPLQRMAAVAHGIAHGNYAQVAPETGPDEVRALAESLNRMARQVQATQQGQRDFLANVSHELRTPLTSIQGFAQAITEGAADSPAAVQRSAGIIQAEAERMQRMVENLLALARLEAKLNHPVRQAVDMRALLQAIGEKFAPAAAAKGVALEATLPADLPSVLGDGDQLAQVFTNLLDNALKHTPAGGRVTLTATTDAKALTVSVADTGPGIPPGDQDRIFERFYQVDKSRAQSGGVGLGLAITKQIVQAHGGKVSVRNAPEQGAEFVVVLPLKDN